MAGDHRNPRIVEGDFAELSETLVEDFEAIFDIDVRVKTYQQRDRLDIHVEPVGVKADLEDDYENITVAPYRDFKFTVSLSGSR